MWHLLVCEKEEAAVISGSQCTNIIKFTIDMHATHSPAAQPNIWRAERGGLAE